MEMNGRTAKTIFGGTAPKRYDGSSWHNADGILDNWSKREWSDGLQIESLEDLDSLCVQTENNTYEITVLSRHTGEVMVRGGHFFPERTPVHLAGSSMGGSFLKLRGIYLGFNLEFQFDGRRIVTSRVKSIGMVVE